MRLLVNATSRKGPSVKRAVLGVVTQGFVVLATALAVFIAINPAIWSDVWPGLSATILEHRRTEMLQMDVAQGRLVGLPAKLSSVVELGFGGWTVFAIAVAIVGWLAIRRWKDESLRFCATWVARVVCSCDVWMPFPWLRYVIPILPPSVCLAAVAVRNLCEDVRTVLRDPTRFDLTN